MNRALPQRVARDRRSAPLALTILAATALGLMLTGCVGTPRQVRATAWGPTWEDCRQRTASAYAGIVVIGEWAVGAEAQRDALTAVCMSASGWKRVYPGIAFAYPNYRPMTPEDQEAWLEKYGASHPARLAEAAGSTSTPSAPLGVATVNGWELLVSACTPGGSVPCEPITIGAGPDVAWETLATRAPGRPFPRRWFLVGEVEVCERYRATLRATGILSLPCTGPVPFQRTQASPAR
jgi:hypothetical protein